MKPWLPPSVQRIERLTRLQGLRVREAEDACRTQSALLREAASALEVSEQRLQTAREWMTDAQGAGRDFDPRAMQVAIDAWFSIVDRTAYLATERRQVQQQLDHALQKRQHERRKEEVLQRVVQERTMAHLRSLEERVDLEVMDIWMAGRYDTDDPSYLST